MSRQRPIRVGIMGFGQTGRQIYELAAMSEDVEIVAVADIGRPHILHYLLRSEVEQPEKFRLEGNFLVTDRFRSRLVEIDRPAEMPWDVFGVDAVIDSTGKFRDSQSMGDHLASGAPRVILRTLPTDDIDRIIIPGLNEASASADDRMISAGSATTGALALLLDSLAEQFEIVCGNMTTVHAYTSDQALQDYAGSDYRRSRSAAKNIIPNNHEASDWIGYFLPQFEGKILTSALNVPVQEGCLLDVNLVMADSAVDAEAINAAMCKAAQDHPGIIGVAEDPIVSSDVIGSPLSLLFDLKGTIKAGQNTIKTLSWYETRGHAARLLDVVRLYDSLDSRKEVA
ncbi:glyceraldehyde-3-phosphate dehydrogenase [Mangrovimicrobium sediminis]|uniref:Glyceraldehyde-3-phosphate dehydrogenase n=1 Tax=Mangrovimicrobium sediminis TaxID=2562682 RepID=A0A4Z0M171_9GAMM|nr:glyceraldehyde 3-phosphate dehydrogenase NAD-binding domain-containing protein [Haliea sp. SAOS-164]TGD73433.1 glyceraldehyde-3-phosphate dehydrogenase [Haliea sp. SAOS-164]